MCYVQIAYQKIIFAVADNLYGLSKKAYHLPRPFLPRGRQLSYISALRRGDHAIKIICFQQGLRNWKWLSPLMSSESFW
jgi:hypothetical protein